VNIVWEIENPAFQIRSSWAQFLMQQRFERVEKPVTYMFSSSLNIPTPPASTKQAISNP
jgi:hypothetical protein